jgi:hypothetical protein
VLPDSHVQKAGSPCPDSAISRSGRLPPHPVCNRWHRWKIPLRVCSKALLQSSGKCGLHGCRCQTCIFDQPLGHVTGSLKLQPFRQRNNSVMSARSKPFQTVINYGPIRFNSPGHGLLINTVQLSGEIGFLQSQKRILAISTFPELGKLLADMRQQCIVSSESALKRLKGDIPCSYVLVRRWGNVCFFGQRRTRRPIDSSAIAL